MGRRGGEKGQRWGRGKEEEGIWCRCKSTVSEWGGHVTISQGEWIWDGVKVGTNINFEL